MWFDKRDIPGGEDWKREIAKGIQIAQRVLFFMSPESCASEYCQGEISHALKHRIHVIPVRINSKMPDDALAQVGLSDKQFIDWADADNKRNWERLLHDRSMIKPPLPRDIRRLEDEYERLHRRYLNTFFRPEFCRVSLSDISDDAPVRGVPLTSVYVPLPVDMSVTIRVDKDDKKTVTDWWIAVEKSETRADENIPDELRGRKLRDDGRHRGEARSGEGCLVSLVEIGGGLGDLCPREPEEVIELRGGRGLAEGGHAHGVVRVALPAQHRGGLHGDYQRAHGQHGGAVRRVLLREQLEAGRGHHSYRTERRRVVLGHDARRRHRHFHFGARRDEHERGPAARSGGVLRDVRALEHRRCGGPGHHAEVLAGKTEHGGTLVPVSYTHLTLPTNREV